MELCNTTKFEILYFCNTNLLNIVLLTDEVLIIKNNAA